MTFLSISTGIQRAMLFRKIPSFMNFNKKKFASNQNCWSFDFKRACPSTPTPWELTTVSKKSNKLVSFVLAKWESTAVSAVKIVHSLTLIGQYLDNTCWLIQVSKLAIWKKLPKQYTFQFLNHVQCIFKSFPVPVSSRTLLEHPVITLSIPHPFSVFWTFEGGI